MARKPTPIVSATGGTPGGGALPDGVAKGIDRVLAVQRPAVLAHIRSIRKRHPGASPADLIEVLERRYLMAVTGGGAAVGASGVVPGIGTAATLALSGMETAGFLEASALFAQSVSEVHGIAVENPERARALVMAMMLGHEGSDLVRQLAAQMSGNGVARSAYWGELVANSLPRAIMGPLTDRLKSAFLHQFVSRGSASLLGKAIPFGVGAVIGGVGNRMVGRKVIRSSRLAFGEAPPTFPEGLEPVIRDRTVRQAAGQTVAGAITGVKNAVPRAVPKRFRRKGDERD